MTGLNVIISSFKVCLVMNEWIRDCPGFFCLWLKPLSRCFDFSCVSSLMSARCIKAAPDADVGLRSSALPESAGFHPKRFLIVTRKRRVPGLVLLLQPPEHLGIFVHRGPNPGPRPFLCKFPVPGQRSALCCCGSTASISWSNPSFPCVRVYMAVLTNIKY